MSEQPRRTTAREGVWRLADPKFSLVPVAGVALGAAIAADEGPLSWPWLLLTIIGVLLLEVARNASGEVFDFDSGADAGVAEADRSPFSGGRRVIVDGLLTRRQTVRLARIFYGLAAAVALSIVWWREPGVLWLGLVGVVLAYGAHAPPLQLAYRGFGEPAVAIACGPLIVGGTTLVQRGDIAAAAGWASVPLGLLAAAFLWINEFPDAAADAAAGKRTLVVRLGKGRASGVFAGLVVIAYTLVVVLPLTGDHRGLWLGLVGLPHALLAARRLLAAPEDTPALVPAQGWMLLSFLLFALGASLGTLLV